MKTKSYICFQFLFFATCTFSQTQDSLVQAISGLLVHSDHTTKLVNYNKQLKQLQIDTLIIPVTQQVILKQDKGKKDKSNYYSVQFYFQKGMAVSSTRDGTFKRAYYELLFTEKKDALSFIELYKHLAC